MYRESYQSKFYTISQREIILILIDIWWRIDPLLGKDLETNNETKAVARHLQQLDYSNRNGDIFYVVHAEELT
jgi:hypothetical protein